ncbi:MAG: EamA family transporter, partial [Oscillospiraceae bacterium]|nr:EamA family transporter [Oscillospiraceae bacterium]
GLLVPFVLSVTLFREMPSAVQIAGFFIALFAIVMINWEKGGKRFGFGLILMLLVNGSADVMAKFFRVYGVGSEETYLLITFGTAFVLCSALAIFKKERPGYKELLYGALIGIPNFFSSKFFLGALQKLPAVVVYPTVNVAAMLIVTLVGVLVFRERLRKLQWFALAAIIAALVLLNI